MIKKILYKINKNDYRTILLVAFILIIISRLLFITIDPDFFWHLKLGELTIENGPVSHDPFSFTFSDYPFSDFEWLSHVLFNILYRIGGLYLLALFYGLIVSGALVLAFKNTLVKKQPLILRVTLFLLTVIVIGPIIGVRPQMATFLGLSLTYFILNKYLKDKSKTIYLLPVLILIWANLHPGFISGIVIISLITFAEIVKWFIRKFKITTLKPDLLYKDSPPNINVLIIVLILSITATLLTPYFYNILLTSVEFAFDSYAMNNIIEWFSPDFHNITGKLFISYIVISLLIIVRRKKINLREVLILGVFSAMAFQCVRHIPLFAAIAIPSVLTYDFSKIYKKLESKDSFLKFVSISILLASIGTLFYKSSYFITVNRSLNDVYKEGKYPIEAVEYLKENVPEGNIFNNYGWGGFLILEYPEKKVFIDGRMASWKIEDERILEEYLNIEGLRIPDWKEKLDEYNIDTALLGKDTALYNALINDKEWKEVFQKDQYSILERAN